MTARQAYASSVGKRFRMDYISSAVVHNFLYFLGRFFVVDTGFNVNTAHIT